MFFTAGTLSLLFLERISNPSRFTRTSARVEDAVIFYDQSIAHAQERVDRYGHFAKFAGSPEAHRYAVALRDDSLYVVMDIWKRLEERVIRALHIRAFAGMAEVR